MAGTGDGWGPPDGFTQGRTGDGRGARAVGRVKAWPRSAKIATGVLSAVLVLSVAGAGGGQDGGDRQEIVLADVSETTTTAAAPATTEEPAATTSTTVAPTTTTTVPPTTTAPPTTLPPTTTAPPATPSPATVPPPPPTTVAPQGLAENCHPSYTPCVPVDSDVDCSSGSGNGPSYTGTVSVIGPDVYDLDRDGDGRGCEDG